jgi:hypothetical protein
MQYYETRPVAGASHIRNDCMLRCGIAVAGTTVAYVTYTLHQQQLQLDDANSVVEDDIDIVQLCRVCQACLLSTA